MTAFFWILFWCFAIPVMVLILCGGVFLWQTHFRNHKLALSDRQIVWLLTGLLVIAMICIGAFLFTVLKWQD